MNYIQTEKFIENQIFFYKIIPLRSLNITRLQLLLYMLKGRSQDIPDREAFVLLQRKLYDLKARWHYVGYGNSLFLCFQVSYIANRHLRDESYIPELIRFLEQSLFHPCLEESDLEEAKTLFTNHLIALNDNPDHLAMVMAIENTPEEHPLSINLFGDLKDIESTTLQDIRDLYRKLEKIDWQVAVGGTVEEEVLEFARKTHRPRQTDSLVEKVPLQKPKFAFRKKEIDQASLLQVYRTGILPDEKLFPALIVANALLGKSQNSLLFEEVREKNSLCYGISSSLVWMDGAMLVRAEILPESIDKALELIQEQIRRVKEGDFSDTDLVRARDEVISGLLFKKDSLLSLLEMEIRSQLLHIEPDLEKQAQLYADVTREQVMQSFELVELISQAIVSPIEWESEDGKD